MKSSGWQWNAHYHYGRFFFAQNTAQNGALRSPARGAWTEYERKLPPETENPPCNRKPPHRSHHLCPKSITIPLNSQPPCTRAASPNASLPSKPSTPNLRADAPDALSAAEGSRTLQRKPLNVPGALARQHPNPPSPVTLANAPSAIIPTARPSKPISSIGARKKPSAMNSPSLPALPFTATRRPPDSFESAASISAASANASSNAPKKLLLPPPPSSAPCASSPKSPKTANGSSPPNAPSSPTSSSTRTPQPPAPV